MPSKQELKKLDQQREQQLAVAKEWALHQATEEEILAGLKEVHDKGGTELGEVIKRLKEQSKAHACP